MSAPQNHASCVVCGAEANEVRPYLTLRGGKLHRNLGYLLPNWMLQAISSVSARAREKCKAISTNRKFFGDKKIFWCDACATGYTWPLFAQSELDAYYRDFYWTNRAKNEVILNEEPAIPLQQRLDFAQARLDWAFQMGATISKAIDFGAGDCSGAYAIARYTGLDNVTVVDNSAETRRIAESLKIRHEFSLHGLNKVDFLYSSHSIEHVHDLVCCFKQLESVVSKGGYFSLEFPNTDSENIIRHIVLTPHTFMLSEKTIHQLIKDSSFNLVASEAVGLDWSSESPHIKPGTKSILRVLLKKQA